ncbi:hypothetical protein LguiA_010976 [Lonicera macranthoides]
MESSYRAWVRHRKEGLRPVDLDELCRELQTALGTAKWQLEEFERAVRLSYRNHSDDSTTTRHMQFVAAIENQISNVEVALKESFTKELNQPFRWVNLDEEERDDLAMFLSGTSVTSESTTSEVSKLCASPKSPLPEKEYQSKDLGLINAPSKRDSSNQTKGFKDADCVIELDANESHGTSDDSCGTTDRKIGTRRVWSSPDIGALKIIIDNEDDEKKKPFLGIETTPKEKGFKPVFWKLKCGHRAQAKGGILNYNQLRGINWVNQLAKRVGGSPRKLQMQLQLQRSCSIQLTLALMLTIILIVPFVLYST